MTRPSRATASGRAYLDLQARARREGRPPANWPLRRETGRSGCLSRVHAGFMSGSYRRYGPKRELLVCPLVVPLGLDRIDFS